MRLYLSSILFVIAGASASLNIGYPWLIAAQFIGLLLLNVHYWNTPDRNAQLISGVPLMIFNIIGVVLLWKN